MFLPFYPLYRGVKGFSFVGRKWHFNKEILFVRIVCDTNTDTETIFFSGETWANALNSSIQAYQNWVSKYGTEELMPGLKRSSEQLFFLSYAQVLKNWLTHFLEIIYITE